VQEKSDYKKLVQEPGYVIYASSRDLHCCSVTMREPARECPRTLSPSTQAGE
jgi:hypothetical protein